MFFPILFYHMIFCSNAIIFGNPICKHIISDNLRNRCFVWLGSTENRLPPNPLQWSLMRFREIPRITPVQFAIHCLRSSGPILLVCKFPSSLQIFHILSWDIKQLKKKIPCTSQRSFATTAIWNLTSHIRQNWWSYTVVTNKPQASVA